MIFADSLLLDWFVLHA